MAHQSPSPPSPPQSPSNSPPRGLVSPGTIDRHCSSASNLPYSPESPPQQGQDSPNTAWLAMQQPGFDPGPEPDDLPQDEDVEMVDLMEYLEREDNPGLGVQLRAPPAIPPRPAVVVLPIPEPYRAPGVHDHSPLCPYRWKPPSIRPIIREEGRRRLLEAAGVWEFISHNFPRARRRFLRDHFPDIYWSEALNAIVVDPSEPHQGRRVPRKVITIDVILQIWPNLPCGRTYDRPDRTLYAPRDYWNQEFWVDTLRFFALWPCSNHISLGDVVTLDSCFHMPLYRFLLRMAYIFGWLGFPTVFPATYFPMTLLTFFSGQTFPWGDLLMRELERDVRYRRDCPQVIRVWKVIWDHVLGEEGQPPAPPPERRYNYVNFLFQCRDTGVPYTNLEDPNESPHYKGYDISPWSPASFDATLFEGACTLNHDHLPLYHFQRPPH